MDIPDEFLEERQARACEDEEDGLQEVAWEATADEEATWGFSIDELKSCIKVLKTIQSNPKLILTSPTLKKSNLFWILNRKRMGFETDNAWDKIKKNSRKKSKQEKRHEDHSLLAKTKLRESRERALQLLPQSGDGHDFTGVVLCNTDRPLLEARFAEDDKLAIEDEISRRERSEVRVEEVVEDSDVKASSASPKEEYSQTNFAQKCYVCKSRYFDLHFHYFCLCPPCAELNWAKRQQLTATQDIFKGRTILLTGSRIKIGRTICLSLLRSGATVIATTRFPANMQSRYRQEVGWDEWGSRLHIYRLDLRNLYMVTRFCQYLKKKYKDLYAIVNNAAQTVARPRDYYGNLFELEEAALEQPKALLYTSTDFGVSEEWDSALKATMGGLHAENCPSQLLLGAPENRSEHVSAQKKEGDILDVKLLSDNGIGEWFDMYDSQQTARDRRTENSWTQQLQDISGIEAAEVHAINALAPFIINSTLYDLLLKEVPELDRQDFRDGEVAELAKGSHVNDEEWPQKPDKRVKMNTKVKRFVINVSAMEGQFYRHKTDRHPHTNMAKASLNMLTRTGALGYMKDGVYMNSVDTGWVTDENPVHIAHRRHNNGNICPIDEVDAAARVLDLIYTKSTQYGKFFKDFREVPW